jgi:hypothetical protein
MLLPMYVVLLAVLSEHNLVKAENTPAFNINRITLLLLEFLHHTAHDYNVLYKDEIVRASDIAGVNLTPREGIEVDADDIEQWRISYGDSDNMDSDGRTVFDEKAWRSRWDWKKMVTISHTFRSVLSNAIIHQIAQVIS